MKTTITKDVLKSTYAKSNHSIYAILAIAILFCLVCLFLVPNKLIAVAVTLFVLAFAAVLYFRYKKLGGGGNTDNAYFRLLPLKEKQEYTRHDAETNSYETELYLIFNEKDLVEVDRKAFDEARENDMYYVAYFSETDTPFACFAADSYEPDVSFPVK